MDKIKKGLGRGLSSLIGETKADSKTNQLSVSDLVPNKFQPRKIFEIISRRFNKFHKRKRFNTAYYS